MKSKTLMKQLCASVVFSALAVSSVNAQDSGAVDSVIQGWSGTASLGANNITGNTEANNINASIRLGKTVGQWEHLVFGSYFKGDATSLTDALDESGAPITTIINGEEITLQRAVKSGNSDRISLGYQPRFYWRPRTYFFGYLDYERDKPANIRLATRQLFGVGHKFYSNASGFFSLEAGLGNKTTEVVLGDDVDGGVGYLAANYLNRINDNLTFNADFRTDLGSDNSFYELGLGLAFKLSERMAVKVSHQTRGNTDITNPSLTSSSKTDGATSINLVLDL